MRRRAAENVFHAVDVHAAGSESRRGTPRRGTRVAAHQNVGAREHARLVHQRFCVRRHHFFAGRADDNHITGLFRPRQVFGDRDRRRDSHGTLRTVLIAVKRALRAAQRVVLENHAEAGTAGRTFICRDERRVERRRRPRAAHLDFKAVGFQIRREFFHRALFDETDFGMTGDVVGEGLQVLVPKFLHARRHAVALGAGRGERAHEGGDIERFFERGHFFEHLARGLALGGRFLSHQWHGGQQHSKEAAGSHAPDVSTTAGRGPGAGQVLGDPLGAVFYIAIRYFLLTRTYRTTI